MATPEPDGRFLTSRPGAVTRFSVIFLAVLAALFVFEWRRDAVEREAAYAALERVQHDLRIDSIRRVGLGEYAMEMAGLERWLEQHRGSPRVPDSLIDVLDDVWALDLIAPPASPAFTDLRSTGRLAAIDDPGLRAELIRYFDTVEPAFIHSIAVWRGAAADLAAHWSPHVFHLREPSLDTRPDSITWSGIRSDQEGTILVGHYAGAARNAARAARELDRERTSLLRSIDDELARR